MDIQVERLGRWRHGAGTRQPHDERQDKADFTTVGSNAYGNGAGRGPPGACKGMIGQIDPARGTFRATTAGPGRGRGWAPCRPGTCQRRAGHLRVCMVPRADRGLAAGDRASFTVTAFDAHYHNITTTDVVWSLTAPLGELANGTLQARRAGTWPWWSARRPAQAHDGPGAARSGRPPPGDPTARSNSGGQDAAVPGTWLRCPRQCP